MTGRGKIVAAKKICKTVHQYNKDPIPEESMKKLLEIAADYNKVKNFVYARYGGIGSLSKIYPGYTVQNEMTESGLRMELGLPSVYFYLAIFDALGDIKGEWSRTKSKILSLLKKNDNFTPEEKHYIRFVIKVSNAFEAIVQQRSLELPKELLKKYEEVASDIDVEKMDRYIRRQVRKYHGKLQTEVADGFSIAERAYRYADHGIYISTKQNRKRIFIPLTDNNRYKSQLYIKLLPEEEGFEIKAAVDVTVRCYQDYTNEIGIALGMYTMLSTHAGHTYGDELGKYQVEYADWIRIQTGIYNRNRTDNPGRKKYYARKRRYEEQLHSYINHELNRFFQIEKPRIIYMVKLPGTQNIGTSEYGSKEGRRGDAVFANKKIDHSVTVWQRGYIRKRLKQKSDERSVILVEVLGKDISNECSGCGALGQKKDGIFHCEVCGYTESEKTNTAKNVLKRGQSGRVLY